MFSQSIKIILLVLTFLSIGFAQYQDDVNIGVVHSELTKQLKYKNNTEFSPILDWELFLLNHKIRYRVFDDQNLEEDDFEDIDVLILPAVEVMSDDAIYNLKNFIEKGKGLLILGKPGQFDLTGNKRNRDALNLLSGISVVNLPDKNIISEKLVFNSAGFLNRGTGSESYLILNKPDPFYAIYFPNDAIIEAEYVFRNNDYLKEETHPSIVSVHKENGRIIWFGNQLSQFSLEPVDRESLAKIFLNSINWLGNKPVAWITDFTIDNKDSTFYNLSYSKNLVTFIETSEDKSTFSVVLKNISYSDAEKIKLNISVPDSYRNLKLMNYHFLLDHNKKGDNYYIEIPYLSRDQTIIMDITYKE